MHFLEKVVDIGVSLIVTVEKALTFLLARLLRLQWRASANGKFLAQRWWAVKLKQSLADIV
jgi:hypothetical protein